ncbi:iron chelate uptake ABC transporter family permease subunit [Caulobacter segnis]
MVGCPGWFAARRRRDAGQGRAMSLVRLCLLMLLVLAGATILAVSLGETPFALSQYVQAVRHPASPPGEVLWTIRAPRVAVAALVGAALGLSGATMQGLLRNPLADPGVLGVSAVSGLGAALAIAGAGRRTGRDRAVGPGQGPGGRRLWSRRWRRGFASPEALILFGVALSAFGGAFDGAGVQPLALAGGDGRDPGLADGLGREP